MTPVGDWPGVRVAIARRAHYYGTADISLEQESVPKGGPTGRQETKRESGLCGCCRVVVILGGAGEWPTALKGTGAEAQERRPLLPLWNQRDKLVTIMAELMIHSQLACVGE